MPQTLTLLATHASLATHSQEKDTEREIETEGKWTRKESVGVVDGDDVVKSRKSQRIANGVYQFGSA